MAVGLLVLGVRALLRLNAASELAVLPAKLVQTVSCAESGPVVLALRGVQFQTGFGGATFTMKSAATGREVASETVLIRSKRSSLAGTVSLAVRRFAIPHAGEFMLEARGLSPDLENSAARLVLVRPHGFLLAVRILWVVGAAGLLLASIVLGVIVSSGRLGQP